MIFMISLMSPEFCLRMSGFRNLRNITINSVIQQKTSILKQIRAPTCSELRLIEQEENSRRTGKLSQKSLKNDENPEKFYFFGIKSE